MIRFEESIRDPHDLYRRFPDDTYEQSYVIFVTAFTYI